MNTLGKPLIMIVLTCGVLAGCSANSKPINSVNSPAATSNSTVTSPPITVEVFEVKSSVAGDELLIPAALSVDGTAIVLAQRDGTVTELRGQEGTRVVKGEVLAQFNDDDQRAHLRQTELEVSRLKVEEQQYEALIKVNRNELEREMSLAKEGLSSKRDVERAQYKVDQATSEYEKTRLATQAAQSRVEAVKIEIEKSTVRAPIAGIITHRHVSLGTSVARNDKLFEISQLSPLEVKFQLPQNEKGRLRPGQLVNLSLVNSGHIVAQARIRRIDPTANATSNTLGYLADVVGGSGLIPGLAVNVRIPRSAVGSTLWIPRAAFPAGADLRSGVASTVLVVDGDRCADRIVGMSTVEGDQVEVSSGLSAGDRVILAPPATLKAGDIVEVR